MFASIEVHEDSNYKGYNFTAAQKSAMNRINNTIKNNLTEMDFSGTRRDLEKTPVPNNKVVKMTASELTIADISRMLRQKIFLEIAIDKALMTLKNNPFAGELYTGELLSSLLETDRDILENKKADTAEIIRIAEKIGMMWHGDIQRKKTSLRN